MKKRCMEILKVTSTNEGPVWTQTDQSEDSITLAERIQTPGLPGLCSLPSAPSVWSATTTGPENISVEKYFGVILIGK